MDPDVQREFNSQISRRGHGAYLLVFGPACFALLGAFVGDRFGHQALGAIGGAIYGLVGSITKIVMDYRAEMAEAPLTGTQVLAERAAKNALKADRTADVATEASTPVAGARSARAVKTPINDGMRGRRDHTAVAVR